MLRPGRKTGEGFGGDKGFSESLFSCLKPKGRQTLALKGYGKTMKFTDFPNKLN
jgi:hypothetical protein